MRLNNMRRNVTINIMKIKGITLFFVVLLTTSVLAVVPTFTSVNPGSLPQGAIDELTIVGTNFQSGITVEISGSGVVVPSVAFESSTQIKPNVIVASDATVGARDILLYNPGESVVRASGYFSITASGTGPAMSVWFSGTKYTNPRAAAVYPTITVDPTFEVRIKFESTAPATLSAASLNGSIVTYTGSSTSAIITASSQTLPASAITILDSGQTAIATVSVSSQISRGSIFNFALGASDANGNTSTNTYLIYSATLPDVDTPSDIPITAEVSRTDKVLVVPIQSRINVKQTKTIPAQIRIAPGRSVRNFTVVLYNSNGKAVYKKDFSYANDQVNKININMVLGNDIPVETGIHTFMVFEGDKKIGKGKLVFTGW